MDAPLPAPEPASPPWRAYFQKSTDAIFFLNRQRRLVFVNRAWESLTGIPFTQVRGLSCRRRGGDSGPLGALKTLMAPPAECQHGSPAQTCRVAVLPANSGAQTPEAEPGRRWWLVHFFPLLDADGVVGVVGKIAPAGARGFFASQPLPEKVISLRHRLAQEFTLDRLVSELPAMQRVAEQARLAGQTSLPVALLGEPGTGKRWLAHCIHGLSAVKDSAFVAVDCRRLPHAALAEVLFGDAGLGRRLRPGSLFLRQPECLPREMQDRFNQALTAWQEQGHGPRVMTAFDSDPRPAVQAGQLLGELYCRLSPLVIELPPLRERSADLGWLVEHLLARACQAIGRPTRSLAAGALQRLQVHSWPGNLRELYDVLLQAAGRAGTEVIETADLPFYLQAAAVPQPRRLPLDSLLEQAEKRLIALALKEAKNNKTEAAEMLAIWRQRLIRRMEALGLDE